ncbi:hypothetical protein CYLTODRAFT_436173 [Cylindrobasidium torrendii FP15055 ss-10]|uniref:Uncharacterized protein n=1 Tax=Cylindrobasidium torrendii FP15055 ss-10 TaxID=1314674 RepID=A0A0D7BI95_9AGAR|nr:hypothetical protein CYLTODRAFT_436173 [Cylindrobasidium torrendii FP15055 ss-10]
MATPVPARLFDPGFAYVTSPFIRPSFLALWRLLVAVYVTIALIYSLAYGGGRTSCRFFSYFTHLTYIGMCSWFWASGVQTAIYAFYRKGGKPVYPLRKWPRPLQWAHECLWSTIATFPIVVTIVYWAILSPNLAEATTAGVWGTVSMHAVNSFLCLTEVLGTNNPAPRWLTLLVDIIILALYLGLAYLSKKTLGFYVYDFLDPKKAGNYLAAYIVGIGVAEVIVFVVMWGIIRLRQRLTKWDPTVEERRQDTEATPELVLPSDMSMSDDHKSKP